MQTWHNRALIAAFALAFALPAQAQQKEIKLGVIYDYTGAFAAGGSAAAGIGTKAAIDMINERGGIEGYKLKATYADAQSKAEVAINEMTRLLDQEKVDLIMGVFSSAHCVPMARDGREEILLGQRLLSSLFSGPEAAVLIARRCIGQFGEASCIS